MVSSNAPTSVALVPERQTPLRVLLFVLLCCVDALILVGAGLEVANVVLGTTIGNFADWTVNVWGTTYTLDPPTFPWVVGGLSALSVVAGLNAAHGHRFAFVMAVGLAWVALGLAALASGSGVGLLAQRLVSILLVFSARSWFRG